MRVMAFGFGMLTLFLYVAAQTGVNSFFINYAEESIHIEKQTASLYLAFGGMGAVLYRPTGWRCHHELYPAKAGAAGLCHPHLCSHIDCGGM